MGKIQKILCLCLLCPLLTGCRAQTEEPLALVNRIQISGHSHNAPFGAVYTNPSKMETLLFYLRGLNPHGTPNTDPERIAGDHYRISISFTDGTRHIYRQQANRFVSVDAHPWQKVDPQKGAMLPLLLGILPPDQEVYSTNVSFCAVSPDRICCDTSTSAATLSV